MIGEKRNGLVDRLRAQPHPVCWQAADRIEKLESHLNEQDEIIGRKDECGKGHKFTQENTYYRPNGNRQCRMCGNLNQRRYAKKQRTKRETRKD